MASEKERMRLYYRATDSCCHYPVGALPLGTELLINVTGEGVDRLELVLTKDGETPVSYEFLRTENHFRLALKITSCGLYFYTFKACSRDTEVNFGSDDFCGIIRNGKPFVQLVYKYTPRPEWLNGGLVYQIFPDRFAIGGERIRSKTDDMVYREDWGGIPEYLPVDGVVRNNDMFGGNLLGIIDKLDYIKSLGVTCIYLNPIFEAHSNHKYNTSDYLRIDSDFGTEKDLKQLIADCKERGIKIILDGVFSHTGDDSIYFDRYGRYGTGAYNSPDSPYYKWYKFRSYPEDYECWWGIKSLPNVNETEPSYISFITEKVLPKWIGLGINGFRLDVADELPDEFLDKLCYSLYGTDAILIGEVWENAVTKISYGHRRRYLGGEQLDGVTNYPIRNAIIEFVRYGNAESLNAAILQLINDYPPHALHNMLNILSTHDTVRILTALSEDKVPAEKSERATKKIGDKVSARKRLMLASLLQYTLPGVPCLFYGDEVGIQGYEDPFCKQCFPWGAEDKKLLSHYRKLGRLRRQRALKGGAYKTEYAEQGLFIFTRGEDDDMLTVIVNAGETRDLNEYSGMKNILTGKKLSDKIVKYGFAVIKKN